MAEPKTVADLIHARFGLPTRAGESVPAEGILAQLLGHRTHRRYKPDPVPDDVLEIALSAALSSPSKSDLQQVGVVLVKDRANQAAIGALIPDMPWIATAPLFMVFCGDNRRIRRIADARRPSDHVRTLFFCAMGIARSQPSKSAPTVKLESTLC